MCPECGAVFHQMQHVRSWSAATLAEFVGQFEFETQSAKAIVLSRYRGLMGLAHRLRFARGKRPNLVYIGMKL
jgi:hypothetical protein